MYVAFLALLEYLFKLAYPLIATGSLQPGLSVAVLECFDLFFASVVGSES